MKQIVRFDPSSLDDGVAALENDDAAQNALDTAESICVEAANNNGLLSETTPDVLRLLKDKGIIQKISTGENVLTHSCLEYGVSCQMPILEKETRGQPTCLEIEQHLISVGWEMVDKHNEASVGERRAVRNNHQTYYDLLLKHSEDIETLESNGLFHHKQSERYYQAVQIALLCRPDELFEVHPYKNAEYYSTLIRYIQGLGGLGLCIYFR